MLVAKVRALLGRHLHTAPLLDGEVTVDGTDLEVTELASNSAAWGGWPRNPDGGFPYDVSEMSLGVGLGGREYDLPFTPIPVFLTRRLDLHRIMYNADSGITAPRDLEGRRVAAGGYFTDVDVYQAAALQEMYGVDLKAVHWVSVREQHIAAVKVPPKVEALPGADVNLLLESGAVAAVTNGYSGSSPRIRPLLDYDRCTERWLAKYGHFPILHTVVVSNALLAEDPEFAQRLYEAFVRAKQPFLRRLAKDEDVWSEMDPEVAKHTFGVTSKSQLRRPDPVPYGIGRNQALLELSVHHLRERGYLSRAWQLEELFAVTGGASG
jgi:4,5-dihydroxyphthalate decarboxylase